jgi:hypothetical protein
MRFFCYNILGAKMKTLKEMLKISESEQILIDKESKKVTFPSRVDILKDEFVYTNETKSAIYVISEALKTGVNTTAQLYFDSLNSQNYEIYFGSTLCVNMAESAAIENLTYLLTLLKKGVKTVYFINVDFNESGTYFYDACGKMSIEKIIQTNALRTFKPTVKERVVLMKQASEFNKKLKTLKSFSFNFGNAFCGIKKLAIIFDGEVLIKSNSGSRIDFAPTKEEVLTELELFYFPAWKSKYNSNSTPTLENAWTITLKFESETLEFSGLDDYPKNWQFVEYFVKKYGGFTEIRE